MSEPPAVVGPVNDWLNLSAAERIAVCRAYFKETSRDEKGVKYVCTRGHQEETNWCKVIRLGRGDPSTASHRNLQP